jgi:deoxyadenosine/deoxycytidine kinase
MNQHFEIISIEGNIGSGKSTLLSNLKKYYENNPNVVFLKEPVDEWEKIKDENGITILEKFYTDQNKYSFAFQMMAYVSRLKVLRDALKEHDKDKKIILITERSLYTDKMVFAKMLFDTGKMEYVNYQIYLNWFDTFSEEFPVHKVIYVKTEPEKCFERISIRARDGESNIPLEYLESCHIYHNKMLDKERSSCICDTQLILDGNVNIYENKNQVEEWITNINEFIYN